MGSVDARAASVAEDGPILFPDLNTNAGDAHAGRRPRGRRSRLGLAGLLGLPGRPRPDVRGRPGARTRARSPTATGRTLDVTDLTPPPDVHPVVDEPAHAVDRPPRGRVRGRDRRRPPTRRADAPVSSLLRHVARRKRPVLSAPMLGTGGPLPAARRVGTRRPLIAALLVAAATLVPSVAAQAQVVDDSTTTTSADADAAVVRRRPRPTTTTTTTTTTAPPVTEAPTTAPPATAPPETAPAGRRPAGHGTAGDGTAGARRRVPRTAPPRRLRHHHGRAAQHPQPRRDLRRAVLAGLGYSFEGPDELFSVHSVNSLKAWQRGQGIRADGIVGAATGGRLGIWGTATPPAGGAGARRVGRRTSARCRSAAAPSRPRCASTRPAPTWSASSRSWPGSATRSRDPTSSSASTASTRSRPGSAARASAPTASSAPPPAPDSASGAWPPRPPPPRRRPRRPHRRRVPTASRPTPAPAGASCTRGRSSGSGPSRPTAPSSRRTPCPGRTASRTPARTRVYSRSMYTYSTANPAIKWRYMVRFAYGPGGGRIGFHEIPNRNGVPLQSEAPARPAAVRRVRAPVDRRRPVDVELGRRRHQGRRAVRSRS